jgi:hypothetical protein
MILFFVLDLHNRLCKKNGHEQQYGGNQEGREVEAF